ncbi:hypothetical protein PGT21_001371 [Puccinia graminis f. sp. tritici]|uniref:Uncharacterized protein n=1 Tax=Puccinia graminis f. sp. tritici TaxID=56615 RepID=A0A5B0LT81_PUCGR|nr:hypothetical protein PGT21_001371 [Puccinia graminis f. sp. tritici]
MEPGFSIDQRFKWKGDDGQGFSAPRTEDREFFKLFIASLQEAYGELYRDPLRTRFNVEEQAHNSRYVDQVDDLLERLEWKIAEPLFDVWFYWIRAIDELEKSRVVSRRKRSILVEERLDTLSDTTPPLCHQTPTAKLPTARFALMSSPTLKKV